MVEGVLSGGKTTEKDHNQLYINRLIQNAGSKIYNKLQSKTVKSSVNDHCKPTFRLK